MAEPDDRRVALGREMTAEVEAIVAAFRSHGVAGPIREVDPRADDEAVFVISSEGAGAMQEEPLVKALEGLLGRKVWVSTDGPAWSGVHTRLVE